MTRQFFGFLKSDNARTAPSETTAIEAIRAVEQIRDSMERDSDERRIEAEDAHRHASVSTLFTAFLPLTFCTSVCYQLVTI